MKKILIAAVLISCGTQFSNAQGAKIARELKAYMNADAIEETIEVKDAAGATHYVKSARTASTYHIGGQSTSNNTVVFDAFNAHPEWTNMNVVVDWTGSMYSYVGQVVRWHHVNKDKQLINNMVLFNDGDDALQKPRNHRKKIGATGGIYYPNHLDIDDFLNTVATAVDHGGGGDGPENDIEAILASQNRDQSDSAFVLIADSSQIRDYTLISQIKRPVHVIMCDNVTQQYINLARSTGGSITWPGGFTDYSQQCHDVITCTTACNASHVHITHVH